MADDGQQSGVRSDARDLRASRTAVLVAAIRASHLRWNRPPIFADDYALQMTPAFFSWLGTTYYLTKKAIRDTLERVAAVAAAGSRIVLDYKYPRRLIPEQSLLFADKVDQSVAKRGEPMRSTFAPEELTAELARAGFAQLDNVPPDEQAQRYLQGRSDMPPPAANFAFALFGRE